MDDIIIKRVSTDEEIVGIRELQLSNLRKLISDEEAEKEGFVTCDYPIEFLRKMNSICPSVIAKDKDTVVGYVLATTRELLQEDELLAAFETAIDKIEYEGAPMSERNYVVVGQLCAAKGYRGCGLVPKMYNFFRDSLSSEFDCCTTDVATHNPRSVKAHQKCGFEIVHTDFYDNVNWYIVLWDWKKSLIVKD